jgi:hypothetical protein
MVLVISALVGIFRNIGNILVIKCFEDNKFSLEDDREAERP